MHPKNFESNRIQKSALETGVCNFKWDFDKIYSHMLMASKCKNHFKIKLHCKLFQFHLEYILRKLFHSKSHTHTLFKCIRCASLMPQCDQMHFNCTFQSICTVDLWRTMAKASQTLWSFHLKNAWTYKHSWIMSFFHFEPSSSKCSVPLDDAWT